MEFVGIQDQVKIPAVLLFLKLTGRGGFQPGIVAASGNTGYRAEFFDRKGIRALLHRMVDGLKNTGRFVH